MCWAKEVTVLLVLTAPLLLTKVAAVGQAVKTESQAIT